MITSATVSSLCNPNAPSIYPTPQFQTNLRLKQSLPSSMLPILPTRWRCSPWWRMNIGIHRCRHLRWICRSIHSYGVSCSRIGRNKLIHGNEVDTTWYLLRIRRVVVISLFLSTQAGELSTKTAEVQTTQWEENENDDEDYDSGISSRSTSVALRCERSATGRCF
jgi:hypothetical protein